MQRDDSHTDFNLQQPCTAFADSISSIEWMSPNQSTPKPPNIFAATTWDGNLLIYEVVPSGSSGVLVEKMCIKVGTPIQSCAWNSDTNTSISLGCINGFVKCADLSSGTVVDIGKHNDPVSKVFYSPSQNIIISIGYDKNIHFWQRGNQNPVFTYPTKDKIYAADFVNPLLILATSQQKILLINVNNMNSINEIDSPLGKFSQIQSIAINPTIQHIGFGTIDGRVEISKIVKNTVGNQTKYTTSHVITFKSNKLNQKDVCYLFPLNAIGFNRRNPFWFFAAGTDGGLNLWDFLARDIIKQIKFGKNPITAAKVNDSGQLIAYATGNDWHMGPQGHGKWPIKICVHYIAENQLKKVK